MDGDTGHIKMTRVFRTSIIRGCASHSPEASQTQLRRVKSICDLARLASGIIVVISVFNSFSFVYGTAHAHGVLLCVRHYTARIRCLTHK